MPAPIPSDGRLTVIVNFYRLEQYAHEVLASLRRSADPRITFLLVDDHSPDATPELLRSAATSIPGAELLLLDRNQGVAAARMRGLAEVRTDWFTFLDGDDWVAPGYYPALLDEVLASGAEWVRTDYVECVDKERLTVRLPSGNRGGRLGSPRDAIVGRRHSSVDFAHSWSGVYHRRLYDEGTFYFPEQLRTAEDRPTIWKLHLQGPDFTIANTLGLFYRRGLPQSLTQIGDDRQLDITDSMRIIGELVDADPQAERFRPKLYRTWAGLLSWHYANRGRLTPVLQRRFIREANALLDTADQQLLADAVETMVESRRHDVAGLRRHGQVLAASDRLPLPRGGAR